LKGEFKMKKNIFLTIFNIILELTGFALKFLKRRSRRRKMIKMIRKNNLGGNKSWKDMKTNHNNTHQERNH
jgi:hypothetical protein